MADAPSPLSSSVAPGLTQPPPHARANFVAGSRVLPGAYGGCASREGGSQRARRACALYWRLTVSLSLPRTHAPQAPPPSCGHAEPLATLPALPLPPGGGAASVSGEEGGDPGCHASCWSSFEAPRLFTAGQLESALSRAPTNERRARAASGTVPCSPLPQVSPRRAGRGSGRGPR